MELFEIEKKNPKCVWLSALSISSTTFVAFQLLHLPEKSENYKTPLKPGISLHDILEGNLPANLII